MAAGVLDQVVAAHETLVAQWAEEALLPSVGAGVAGQLIRAGKLLLAVGPGARERPLTCSAEAGEMGAELKHLHGPGSHILFFLHYSSGLYFLTWTPLKYSCAITRPVNSIELQKQYI